MDRLVERLERFLDMSGQATESGQSIKNVVRLGLLLQQLFQVLASSDVVAGVDERYREIEVLLGRLELKRGLLQMLVASLEVDFRPIAPSS